MASIFKRIINGEIPCYKIAEDDNCFAFLDINPLNQGHTLVVPKQEVDYIYDLDDELLSKLFLFSKKVALAIEKAIPCERIGVAVIGLEVPHAHIHLCPINGMSDLNFANPKKQFSKETFEETAAIIRANL
ncbi:MAG: HIT family protein [Bacteroidetes bacterium]|nr:HIT family protein [Bacteroidota bacterium]